MVRLNFCYRFEQYRVVIIIDNIRVHGRVYYLCYNARQYKFIDDAHIEAHMHEHVGKPAFVKTFNYYQYLVGSCIVVGTGGRGHAPEFYNFSIGFRFLPRNSILGSLYSYMAPQT